MGGELVSDGTTVLLTTQYLEEADTLASRVAVVDGPVLQSLAWIAGILLVFGTLSVRLYRRAV